MRRASPPGPVIIGGGPAGAAAAIALARAGAAVTLIERSCGPCDKVCGDFLSVEAIAAATSLGVDPAALGAAPMTAVRLIHANRVADAALPFPALGLSRRALDEALLRQAAACGATILRGHAVRSLTRNDAGLQLDGGSLGRIAARSVFLATGKHELRGAARASHGARMVGLKMYYALDPRRHEALRQHVELVLFDGGYAGLQPVEGDRAVLCVLLSAARLRAGGGQWDSLLASLMAACPHLADRLCGARPLLAAPLAVAGLPFGYRHTPRADDTPGLFRLGDQAAVIPSFTGDGVALALGGGTLAAETLLAGGDAAHYHRRLAAGVSRQMRVASAIHRACLAPAAQPWVVAAAAIWPGVLRSAAAWTRSGLRPETRQRGFAPLDTPAKAEPLQSLT